MDAETAAALADVMKIARRAEQRAGNLERNSEKPVPPVPPLEARQLVRVPTGVAFTGSGAGNGYAINADGSVSVTKMTSLRLEGLMDAGHHRYEVRTKFHASADDLSCFQLVSGSTPHAGNNYFTVGSYTNTGSSTPLLYSAQGQPAWWTQHKTGQVNRHHIELFDPMDGAEQTTGHAKTTSAATAQGIDAVLVHTINDDFDGLLWYPNSGTITGSILILASTAPL